MSGSTMGVDIRVPAEWTVEARVVEGKKCIGTHSGSCEYIMRTLVQHLKEGLRRVAHARGSRKSPSKCLK